MSRNNAKDFLLTMLLIVIFTLLTALPQPTLTILASALVTALIGYSVTKFHYGYVTLLSFVVLVINLLFQTNFLSALTVSMPVILCGLTLGIAYNLKLSVLKLICVFTTVYVLDVALNIKLASVAFRGENLFESVVSSVGQMYRETLVTAYGSALPAAEIDAVVSQLTSTLLRFTPGFIVISCAGYALLCYYIFKRFLKLKKADTSSFNDFLDWHADRSISIFYFILMFIYFLIPTEKFLSDVLLNMVTIMSFVFFILGLAFLEFKLKTRLKRSGTRKLIVLAVSLSSFLLMGLPFFVLSIVGAFDGFFDYRHKKVLPH